MPNSVPKLHALRWAGRCALICVAVLQSGCYYLQAAQGQMALTRARQPIEAVIADPTVPDELRRQLALVERARAFAHEELGLPDNGSYTSYVDLQRDYVVLNVFAAPALSLEPRRWCYPFVGCMAYRGYFDAADARDYAARLSARGFDVATRKVPAYSTLGRFKDPVLSTMLTRNDDALVSLLFHELAHQLFYVDGDTAFNESFASFVATEGLRRWRTVHSATDLAPDPAALLVLNARRGALRGAVNSARERLSALYASDVNDDEKRRQKAVVFRELDEAWRAAGATTAAPDNNAELLPLSLYNDLTPAFAALLDRCDQSLECVYSQARALGDLDVEARQQALAALPAD